MLGYAKIWQSISKKQYILGFKVNKIFWITFYTAKHYFSTLSSVILWLFIKNGSHGWTAVISTVNFKWLQEMEFHSSKSALSRLRKFLKIESLLKMTKRLNDNLIINDSLLFNSNMTIGTHLDQKFDLRVQFIIFLKASLWVCACACDSTPLLKGPDIVLSMKMYPS